MPRERMNGRFDQLALFHSAVGAALSCMHPRLLSPPAPQLYLLVHLHSSFLHASTSWQVQHFMQLLSNCYFMTSILLFNSQPETLCLRCRVTRPATEAGGVFLKLGANALADNTQRR